MALFAKKKQKRELYPDDEAPVAPVDDYDDSIEDDYSNFDENIEGDNSRWEVEYSDILESIYRSLRNQEFNREKGEWIKAGPALMNREGISHFLSYFKMIMHRGVALSNFDLKYINDSTKRASKAYKGELMEKYDDWEVEKSYFRAIVLLFAANFKAVLSRAEKGREQSWRAKKNKFVENYRHDEVKGNEISRFHL